MDTKLDHRFSTRCPDDRRDVMPRKSRAAEYIAVLYIALLVCAPWLVRDSSIVMPPSTGIEVQVVNKAVAHAAGPKAAALRSQAAN